MRRSTRIVAVVTALALAVVGCSGGDDDATTTTTQRPRGTELVIGYLGQETGGVLASGTPATEGRAALSAWARWTNAQGGIDGHPVRIVVRDGGNDPEATLRAARELVDVERVIAVVGQQDTCCFTTWADEIGKRGIPIIGGQVQTLAPIENPMVFAQGASVLSLVHGQVAKVKAVGKTRFGHLYCIEQPNCGQANDFLRAAAGRIGVVYAYDKAVAADQDFTAACLAAKESAVEVLQLNGVSVDRVTRDCARQDYKPVFGIVSDVRSLLDVPELDGAVGVLPSFPAFHVDAATKDFRAAMQEYAASLEPTVVSSQAWLAGLAFAEAVSNAGAERPTAADVLRGLLEIKDETFGGLTPPISYGPAGQPNPVQRCYYLFQIKRGGYVAPQGLRSECEPVG